ncbi:helix-turn-helix domain-containing protein [Labrys wisconsinensis]|uniref:XRE-type DNA-binding protein n=1 Tax=Labrys wisconsinensis TaxID=425677 RepID=A0ABU0J0M4_9HYPH|nr:helix-turn-helix transcriptional regulator [Labrys wisconsinensis]MDQ0467816.1 putative XRE-type DNA-binding protein [Labrys wisconsinensis]
MTDSRGGFEMTVERGTGNVFADLGLPDAANRQTKTRLALAVTEIIKDRKLRQVEAAKVLGIPQSKVSALMNYRLDGFSVERLMSFLTRLHRDVEIVIRPSRDDGEGRVSVHALL